MGFYQLFRQKRDDQLLSINVSAFPALHSAHLEHKRQKPSGQDKPTNNKVKRNNSNDDLVMIQHTRKILGRESQTPHNTQRDKMLKSAKIKWGCRQTKEL